ncbi:MAG: Isoniazid-inducible protein iniA [Acidimicrobiales bacterium]|nr:MAG: Isoniazid-inducible protein iniA [Acidimicrobiales bacterium]
MPSSTQIEAIDLALETIVRYNRPDLNSRLRQARARLQNGYIRVLVVGEFKQGKSLLVNGLVRAPVCPVYDDVATSVPTVVHYADAPVAALVRILDSGGDPSSTEGRVERVELPISELAQHISDQHISGNGSSNTTPRWHHAEVGIPRAELAGGLELVDTPGVGGLNSVHGAATMTALPSADAVLLVSDASQEYTAPELDFLRQAVKVCPNVACILTKTDLYPEWRRIAELDRGHLAAAGIDAELLAVSSTLRVHAIRSSDADLDAESGFPALMSYLTDRVVGQADLLACRSTAHDVLAVTGQLAGNLRSEYAAHSDPQAVGEVIKQLSQAQQHAEALKERSARWQHTLNDGVGDLNADIDYDLRDRMREIVREAEEELDNGGDPKKVWEQLSGWVEQEVNSAAAANFLWATQRARWLTGQVGDHFSVEGAEILPKLRTETDDALNYVRAMQLRDSEPFGIMQKGLTGLRGSYVGVLMFGMLGTVVGLPLINPFSVGAGLLLGGKGLTDERRRIVARRQSEAKTAVRRYVDDVIFQVGKESRDMLRRVQRDLRDHFTERAEELNLSLKTSLQTAENSVRTSKSQRERRLVEIPSELKHLEALERKVQNLLPQPGSAESVAATPLPEAPLHLTASTR